MAEEDEANRMQLVLAGFYSFTGQHDHLLLVEGCRTMLQQVLLWKLQAGSEFDPCIGDELADLLGETFAAQVEVQ